VLFAGGHGRLNIFDNGSIGWAERSFLVRNRVRFAEQGLAVVVLDAPSDKRSGLGGFRDSAEHAADVGSVIAWLREKSITQVWLIGHSRGTESVVSAATKLGPPPKGPDGLVLASSILSSTMFVSGLPVTKFPLAQLVVPVLLLHHDADSCSVTRPRDLPNLVSMLPATLPRKSVLTFSGGLAPGSLCDVDSHHSFAGQDESAIDSIMKFIAE
jgi:alpha-beta hydrolase superfamily lysophospholipase